MNFKDMLTKLNNIEEGIEVIGGPMPAGHPVEQPDNVNMSVNLNGSGAGGVKDLMKILKDIETVAAQDNDHETPIMGDVPDEECYIQPEESMEETFEDDHEDWGNSAEGGSGHHVGGVDAVTPTGNDMNSKGKVSPLARAPGTNALQHPMHESLVDKLTAMYEEIKGEQLHENDFEKALHSTSGGYTGWNHMQGKTYENYGPYQSHVKRAVKNGAQVYHYDDGEGGYDATGEVVHDKHNGVWYAVLNKEPSMHKDLGSLMDAIRTEIGENGRRHDANHQNRSDNLERDPFDPEKHLYKTDRAGKKGMLNKGRIDTLTSPYRREINGPQGVLPEQMNESKELNDIIALTKILKG